VRLEQNLRERKQLRQQQNEQQQQLLHHRTFSPLGPTALWQGRLASPDLPSAHPNTLQMNRLALLKPDQQQARLQGQFGNKAGQKISVLTRAT
jgi:hypothetical protein